MTKKEIIDELLSRGVGEFIDPDGSFRKKLETNPEKVVIKFGIDPTRPDIHIGHAVVLHKLRKFQDLGAKVVFLIGDYTGQIGDPTGKNQIRPEIQLKEIEGNMKTYLLQVGKILSENPKVFSWIKNSDWFTEVSDVVPSKDSVTKLELQQGKQKITVTIPPNSFPGKALLLESTRMQKNVLKNAEIQTISLSGVLRTLRHITHSRLIARDMFQERIKKNEELYMHEMLYPVLQGLDSHVLHKAYGSCDMEIGGTDQTFNMLMGRDVMKMYKQPEQAVMSLKILEGTDGKEKMSKSLDNYIAITDEPADMYGKVMSIPDSSILNYYELCTFTPVSEVEEIKKKLEKNSVNPKEIKMALARQIVSIYHGEGEAAKAEENFIKVFQNKEKPEAMATIKAGKEETLMDALVKNKNLGSKSEFRRLITEGAITDLDSGEKIKDPNFIPKDGQSFKIGKKTFIKVEN